MKNKVLKPKLRMNLQFFAEPGGDGTGDGAAGTNVSFDDFLKGEGNQAEFDRRVQSAVSEAVKQAQEKWDLLTNDKVSEAEKLAKMSKEEKEQYQHNKKVKELNEREATIKKRELMAEAKNTLTEKKLPVTLAELLNYADADSCKKSIDTVEKIFQEAVQAAVDEKLKGGAPIKKAPNNQDTDLAKQVEAIMRGRF